MSLASATWRGRHKGVSRRLWRDIRALLPMIGVLFCFASSATVIVAAERTTLHKDLKVLENLEIEGYFNISRSSTSNLSAAPAGIRPVALSP